MKAGFSSLRTRTSVEERPSASAAWAFPNAISNRIIEEPSSFWNAFTLQPGSTTTTDSGRQLSSAPRDRIASMMRFAGARVSTTTSSLPLPDGGAERVGRIDAENLQRIRLGKERQLLQRQL